MLTKDLRERIINDAKVFGLNKALEIRRNCFALNACFFLKLEDYEKAKEFALLAEYLDNLHYKSIFKPFKEEVKNG